MEIQWKVDRHDIRELKAFLDKQHDRPFVRSRIALNVKRRGVVVSKDRIWFRIVSCLLTTQQPSGPGSAVFRFLRHKPFLLAYKTCCQQRRLESFAIRVLRDFGGLRRYRNIAAELSYDFQQLEGGLWKEVLPMCRGLTRRSTPTKEREAARFIAEHLSGFGPKQARNLLQSLGLTRYEIPLDSRITKWLNDFGFPIRLKATALSDPSYYELILDGVQTLCQRVGTYPCVLDAAIFTSFDKEEWPEDGRPY